jgi:DNA polymerase I-like protein with 3'-5' exonuclease and polymerase domains
MSKKDLCNYPIQGTAFHLMLWSLMYICDHLRMVSTNIGQIHDDMLFDAVPEEVPEIMAMGDEALAAMKRKFPWICVPFSIKWSVTNINESWSTQHVVKV